MDEEFPLMEELKFINSVGQKWGPIDCDRLQGTEKDKCFTARNVITQYGYNVMRIQQKAATCQRMLDEQLEDKSKMSKFEGCMKDVEADFTMLVEQFYPQFKGIDEMK